MPDIQNFVQTIGANQSVTVPRVTLEFTVNDSVTGAIQQDFRGANAIVFPARLGTLSAARRAELFNVMKDWMFREVMGLNP